MVPFVQFSGISCPLFILFIIPVVGWEAQFPVSFYSSPGIPSPPFALLFAMFRCTISISRAVYSWLRHVSVSGSAAIILVSLACFLIVLMSYVVRVSSPPFDVANALYL